MDYRPLSLRVIEGDLMPDSKPDNTAQLLEKLGATRPDLAFGQPYKRREGGDCEVLLFKNEVARFRRKPDGQLLRLEKEIADKAAGQGDFQVPATSYVSPEGDVIIQSRLSGDTIVMAEHPGGPGTLKVKDMTAAEVSTLARGIAECLAAVHVVTPESGPLQARFREPPKDALKKFLAQCPEPALAAKLAVLLEAPESKESVALHGDLGPGNFLFDRDRKDKQTGVIDFSRTGSGPRASDFGYLALMSPALFSETAAHYKELTGVAVDRREALLCVAAVFAHYYTGGQHDHGLQRLKQVADRLESPNTLAPARTPGASS